MAFVCFIYSFLLLYASSNLFFIVLNKNISQEWMETNWPFSIESWRSTVLKWGEVNGNPLQYSCLENPMDRGAWWAAVYRVAQSQTRLKWSDLIPYNQAGRSNQSILKEIKPEYSLEELCWSWSPSTSVTWCEELTHWKSPDAGKDLRQKEKRVKGDEMAGWHHQFSGHELGQTPGDGEGQGSLVCCSPWGHKWIGQDLVTEQWQQLAGSNSQAPPTYRDRSLKKGTNTRRQGSVDLRVYLPHWTVRGGN